MLRAWRDRRRQKQEQEAELLKRYLLRQQRQQAVQNAPSKRHALVWYDNRNQTEILCEMLGNLAHKTMQVIDARDSHL